MNIPLLVLKESAPSIEIRQRYSIFPEVKEVKTFGFFMEKYRDQCIGTIAYYLADLNAAKSRKNLNIQRQTLWNDFFENKKRLLLVFQ